MQLTFTEEALYTQATSSLGHPSHLRQRKHRSIFLAIYTSALVDTTLIGALKGAMLTVTTKLARGGNLLGRSIGDLGTKASL